MPLFLEIRGNNETLRYDGTKDTKPRQIAQNNLPPFCKKNYVSKFTKIEDLPEINKYIKIQ